MKKIIFALAFTICSINLFAQQANDILGYWLNEEGDAKVEIYIKNNKFFGKIVWLKTPKGEDENGEWRLDFKNPDKTLRNRKKLGLEVMQNLIWNADEHEWSKGQIYDAREGDTYSLHVRLKEHNVLNLKGYIGFSLFGKTTTWTRTEL